jgi:hypothetical protein
MYPKITDILTILGASIGMAVAFIATMTISPILMGLAAGIITISAIIKFFGK